MRRFDIPGLLLAVLLCLVLRTAKADFKTGLQAYEGNDYATALKEWQPLAEKGDANSQYNLGLLYARGLGVTKNYAEAAKWYQKAAEQGVAAAQYNLGIMYGNGEGVPKDPSEAMKWFLKAAEQGVAPAEYSLGNLYNEGEGAFKSYAEAQKWYRSAAEKGVASAQFNLAIMYDLGHGVPKDYGQALKWYDKAAKQGYASALTNIGILYYNGQGVERDLVRAYAYFDLAATKGDPRAADLRKTTAEKIPPKLMAKAEAASRELKAGVSSSKPIEVAADESRLFKTSASVAAAAQPAPAPIVPAAQPAPAPVQLPVQDVWTGIDRIVAVGDIHGDYEQLVAVLQSAGLIDSKADWMGGKTHLVQTGDILDRGPDSRHVMDLLMKLEKQSLAAGGYVHCLIGNHEAMNVYGDLRYVSPGEFAAFRTESSEKVRETSFSQYRTDVEKLTGLAKPDLDRTHWESEHPPGLFEHRAQLGANGPYGKWISSHNAIIKINDTLFTHAGIGPKYAAYSISQINQRVREELRDQEKLHGGIVTDQEGPLWYSGLAKGDERKLEPLVTALLENNTVQRIVIGHAYARAAITPRFGGKVIMVDIGLPRVYDNIGKLGCLLIEKDKPYALHRGTKLELPKDSGPDMLRYLKQAAALDPPPSPLASRIAGLEAKVPATP